MVNQKIAPIDTKISSGTQKTEDLFNGYYDSELQKLKANQNKFVDVDIKLVEKVTKSTT